jgi:phenolic acid decarboxylase
LIAKFDRELASNERMLIYVEYQLPDSSWDLYDITYILDATDINAGTNNTYTWDTVLAPNKYRLRYISKYDSTGSIPTNPNSDVMSQEFDIVAPPPVTFTHTETNALCKGDNNGTITITASGGTASGFQYSINNGTSWQSSNTFTGLAPATYNLLAKDSNNCISQTTASVIINEPFEALTLSPVIVKDPSANGVSDGEISIALNGGTGIVTYQWVKDGIAYATTQNITSLDPGIYNVTATDANGCTFVLEFTLQEPPPLSILFTTGTIDCNGGTTNITAQGQGGFISGGDDYDYLWNDNSTNQTILNVIAGTYTVTITDSNGATTTDSITLVEPDVLDVTVNTNNVFCNGGADGAIDLSIIGGTSPFTINWIDDNTITTEDRTGLTSGEYFYTISDVNNCSINGSVVITEPLAILITVDMVQHPTTAGGTDGSIDITVTQGTAPFTFQWTDAANNIVSTTEDITGLSDGTYTLTVTDANFNTSSDNSGCSTNISVALIELQPLSVTIIETNPISCSGNSDGELTANPIGGTASYTYEWFKENNGNFVSLSLTTQSIIGLSAGNYRVIATDIANATAQIDFVLTEPNVLALTFITQDINCFGGSDGLIDITPTGGTAPYTYSWNDASATEISISEDLSNVISGNYTISIVDSRGCTIQDTIELFAPTTELTITLDQLIDPSGSGLSDGSVNISVTGGTASYTYQWTDDIGTTIATTQDISNIGEGIYTLTVSDNNASATTDNSGCIISEQFVLLAPDTLIVSITETSSIFCNGDALGTLTATASGGFLSTASDYNYEWFKDDNGSFTSINQTTAVATDLIAGIYLVTITDDNGISQSETYSLTEPELLNIILDITNTVSCASGVDGIISSVVSGGTAPYTYQWNNGDTTTNISNLTIGTYTLTVTDNNGCELSANIDLTQPGGMSVESIVTPPQCFGSSDATISLTTSGGTMPYSYLWNTGSTASNISNITAGNYDVTITDNVGCITVQNFTVQNPDLLTLNLGDDMILCQGQSFDLDVTINDLGANYQWTSTNGFSSNTATVALTDSGEYFITITNSNGCTATDRIIITTTDQVISADFLVPTQAFVGETIVVVDVSEPVPDSVSWSFSNGTTIVSQNGDYAELMFEQEGVYNITMTTTKGNCQKTLTKEIIVQPSTGFGTDQDTNTSFIKEFKLYPNPNTGIFKAQIELQQQAPISIKIINLNSNIVNSAKIMEGQDNYIVDYNINTAIGLYLVILETPKGSQIRKIIVE